jgi:hypothetical protein
VFGTAFEEPIHHGKIQMQMAISITCGQVHLHSYTFCVVTESQPGVDNISEKFKLSSQRPPKEYHGER